MIESVGMWRRLGRRMVWCATLKCKEDPSAKGNSRTSLLALPLIAVLTLTVLADSLANAAVPHQVRSKYKAAIVVNLGTGEVLFADKAHTKVIPASLVKMMLALIVMEGVEKGNIKLSDTYTVSAAASRIGGHQVYLKQGETFQLRELLKAVIIGSANDAAFAVAEHVGGSHDAFVQLMNKRARALGMTKTAYANVHGLPPNRRKGQKENYSTAHDLALLGARLTHYPLIMRWASTRLDSFRNGTFQLLNTNHRFLRAFDGADGLKTGYHSRGAGFSIVGTAVRGQRRLLAVVMGASNSRDRLEAANKLLTLGFKGQL